MCKWTISKSTAKRASRSIKVTTPGSTRTADAAAAHTASGCIATARSVTEIRPDNSTVLAHQGIEPLREGGEKSFRRPLLSGWTAVHPFFSTLQSTANSPPITSAALGSGTDESVLLADCRRAPRAGLLPRPCRHQIGRASCRDRGYLADCV